MNNDTALDKVRGECGKWLMSYMSFHGVELRRVQYGEALGAHEALVMIRLSLEIYKRPFRDGLYILNASSKQLLELHPR